jgi:hypothetical protein
MRRGFSRPLALLLLSFLASNCATVNVRPMTTTAYCGCAKCCSWQRGRWLYLRLNVWNRYVSSGPRAGAHYDGRTAAGTKPRQPAAGLLSADSIIHPWMIPIRIVFFPWMLLPHPGTIAADTSIFPFGTRMRVPGYGWGIVEDRGSAIQGTDHIDLYFRSHRKALRWGRQNETVQIILPN